MNGFVKKEWKYISRYWRHIISALFESDKTVEIDDNEYWYSWRLFCPRKYMVFRVDTVFGFGAIIPMVIQSFEWADEMGFIPICYYADTNELLKPIDRENNRWDLFFMQMKLADISDGDVVIVGAKDETYCSKRIKKNYFYKNLARGYLELEEPDWREYYRKLNFLYKKWIKYNDQFLDEIETEWNLAVEKSDKVLAVLVREEFSIDRELLSKEDALHVHPWVAKVESLLDYVEELLSITGCNKIYIGTTFEDTIELFKGRFGSDRIMYAQRKRGLFSEWKKHRIEMSSKKYASNDIRNKGIDGYDYEGNKGYLKDLLFSAKCDSMVGQMCGATRTALIINGGEYEFYQMIPNYKELSLVVRE